MKKELTDEEFLQLKTKCAGEEIFELCIEDEDMQGNPEKLFVYVAKPSRGAFNIFQNAVLDNNKVLSAAEVLVYSCVRAPEKKDLALVLDDKKSYVQKILTQLIKLEGDKASVSVKKRG